MQAAAHPLNPPKVGRRVYVENEGPGTVTRTDPDTVYVRIDADGQEVAAGYQQVKPLREQLTVEMGAVADHVLYEIADGAPSATVAARAELERRHPCQDCGAPAGQPCRPDFGCGTRLRRPHPTEQECRDCGKTFPHNPDADYCPACVADMMGNADVMGRWCTPGARRCDQPGSQFCGCDIAAGGDGRIK